MEIMLRFVAILGLFALAIFLLILIYAMVSAPIKMRRKEQMIKDIDAMFKELLEEKNKGDK